MVWSIQNTKNVYNIEHWSQDYFDVNEQGNLVAYPQGKRNSDIELCKVSDMLVANNISQPCLIRFTDILRHRLQQLQASFYNEITKQSYQGKYTAVYPIKVNQQRHVVEALLKNSENFGLEAGSKPELMAVMALANKPGFTIICNGYKDREYIRLALIGKQLGLNVYIIIEKSSEIELVMEESAKLDIEPLLGLRIRLASIAAGNWQNTGGEKSKFGLTYEQTLTAIEQLKQANLLNSLKLLHAHMGSQISNIRDIQKGLQECSRFYAELHSLDVQIETIDIGGGLGIDYEGSRSRNYCSTNYSLKEYAYTAIKTFHEICLTKQLPHPNIITEAGRAMTAHHAVLFAPIIAIERLEERKLEQPGPDSHPVLKDLWHCHQALHHNSIIEVYHELCHYFNAAQQLFNTGLLSLTERAQAETIYTTTCLSMQKFLKSDSKPHRAIFDELNEKFSEKIFCNFSLFQSLPDVWAINQIFPILPIQKLQEKPSHRAVIQDITCDSDGRIDNYIDGESIEKSLPLPNLEIGDTLAIFLVGAYQETLGDMHNLFGDTHVVNIEANEKGGYEIESIETGDTIDELLSYVHFDTKNLLQYYKNHLANTHFSEAIKAQYLKLLESGMSGYTYLES